MAEELEFSNKELQYLQDTDFLLTKREINQKINQLLVATEKKLSNGMADASLVFPEGTLEIAGKISQGENYRGLPYFMLDFPRKFSKKGVFAFRTMFWWGNFFSATLHLQGNNLESFRKPLLHNSQKLYGKDIYFCVADTPWHYHYQPDNYLPVDQMKMTELQEKIYNNEFVKLSKKLNLDQWEYLPRFAYETFHCFIDFLKKENS